MVRAYPPQAFHGDVAYNTNYPPQSSNEGGSVPIQGFFYLLEDGTGFYATEPPPDSRYLTEDSP